MIARRKRPRVIVLGGVFASLVSFTSPSAAITPKTPPPPLEIAVAVTPVEATKWTVRLRNVSSAAVRVPIDARLVSFELSTPPPESPRARRAPNVTCALPAEMRPDADETGTLEIATGGAVVLDVDPRLYCFGAREAAALETAVQITARYTLFAGPGHEARTAVSEPVAVPKESRPPLRPGPETDDDEDAVVVTTPARIDGVRAASTAIRVTVKNNGPSAKRSFMRPGNIGFLVEGPAGAFACPVKGTPPIRELETTLPPRGNASVEVLLGPTCPGRSFDRPGLYVIRPVFAPKRPRWDQGKSLFGEHRGAPALVRLRTARLPLISAPPRLE